MSVGSALRTASCLVSTNFETIMNNKLYEKNDMMTRFILVLFILSVLLIFGITGDRSFF